MLVRKDLSVPQQAVQGGHAIAEYLLHHPCTVWDNGTLVYLGVKSEDQLNLWGDKLTDRGIDWKGFREPDIGDQMTALAAVSDGKAFSNLKLL